MPVRDTQTDRQTQLKIMALQVCNWANTVGWLDTTTAAAEVLLLLLLLLLLILLLPYY